MDINKFDTSTLETSENINSWIDNEEQFVNLQPSYLLSFSDEGVIWGKVLGKQLITAEEHQDPMNLNLRWMQQIHVFNSEVEYRFWKVNQRWNATVLMDGGQKKLEDQVYLWGTHVEEVADSNGFTLVADGKQGLRHRFPKVLTNNDFKNESNSLKLKIHQYISFDEETGQARISGYRLVDLEKDK